MTPSWPPRDWRMLIALFFLGGGGIAMTSFAWRLATLTAQKSSSPWPIAYALYGTLFLLGIVLTGFSFVLGKRAARGKVGKDGVEFDTSGGEDEPAPASSPTIITTTKVQP